MPRRHKGEEHAYSYHRNNKSSHHYNPNQRVFDGEDVFHKHPVEPEWETAKKEAEVLHRLEVLTDRKDKRKHPIKTRSKKTKRVIKRAATRRDRRR
jgi:hypothetical protein